MNIEKKSTYYTAVGHFRRKTDASGHTYPVILVNQEEHMVDIQEMAVWSTLSWRFLHLEQIEGRYSRMASDLPLARRTLETCLNRLEIRGLIARGVGDTDIEALYDLLGGLYVVPISESLPLRLATFGKLLLDGVPFSKAKRLFQKDKPSQRETQVMALSRQAPLSTAELIKCAEAGATDVSTDEKLMEVLIDNDYTSSDSIVFEMPVFFGKMAGALSMRPGCRCAESTRFSRSRKNRAIPLRCSSVWTATPHTLLAVRCWSRTGSARIAPRSAVGL